MSKKKVGRPKKPDSDKKNQELKIWLTAEEKENAKQAAGNSSLSLSEWVRRIIKKTVKK